MPSNQPSRAGLFLSGVTRFRLLGAGVFLVTLTSLILAKPHVSAGQREMVERIGDWVTGNWYDPSDPTDDEFWSAVKELLEELSDELAESQIENTDVLRDIREFPTLTKSEKYKKSHAVRNGVKDPVPVNYGFGVFCTPDLDSTPSAEQLEDRKRFSNFIAKVQQRFERFQEQGIEGRIGDSHCRDLRGAMGLGGSYFPELGISWIQVASDSGAYACYPGNIEPIKSSNATREEAYDPRTRPWWPGGAEDHEHLRFKLIEAGVSNLYRDWSDDLAERGTHSIRTLWCKVPLKIGGNDREYVIGIDFLLFGDEVGLGTSVSSGISKALLVDEYWYYSMALGVSILLGSLALLTGGLGALRRGHAVPLVSSHRDSSMRLRRVGEPFFKVAHKQVEIQESTSAAGEGVATEDVSEIGASISASGVLQPHARRQSKRATTTSTATNEESLSRAEFSLSVEDDPHTRGFERWQIVSVESLHGRCESCRQVVRLSQVESPVGRVDVTHRAASRPEIFATVEPSRMDDVTAEMKQAIKRRLEDHIFQPERYITDEIDVDGEPIERRIPLIVSELPDVRQLEAEYLSLSQGRARLADSVSASKKLYHDSPVRATCRVAYLEMLRQRDALNVLGIGDSVERVVIAKDMEELEAILLECGEYFINLQRDELTPSLRYVLSEDLPGNLRAFRDLDFSIVDQDDSEIVLVADTGSLVQHRKEIPCDVLWRVADLRFYEAIYSVISNRSKSIKADVIAELSRKSSAKSPSN